MKISIVTPYAFPEKGAASARIESFYQYFKSKGHLVELVVPKRPGFSADKDNRNKRYGNIFEAFKLLKNSDSIIITSPPIKTAFLLAILLKIYSKKYFLDFRDLSEYGKMKKMKKILEKISVKMSSGATVTTEYIANKFSIEYGLEREKIAIIANGYDDKIFFKKLDGDMRKKLNIPEESKILVYEGIVGDHELTKLFESLNVKDVVKNDFYLLFLFIVGDTEKNSEIQLNEIINSAKKNGLTDRIRIMKNVDFKKIKDYISIGDFGLVSIPSNKENLYRIPVKAYEYLACGIPIISKGPNNGELQKLIEPKNGIHFSSWEEFGKKFPFEFHEKINMKEIKKYERKSSAKKFLDFIESKK